MNEVLLTVSIVVFILYAAFVIAAAIELRRTGAAIRQFLARTEAGLHPALAAMRAVLEDVMKTTSNVASITESVRDMAGTAEKVKDSVQELYENYGDGMSDAVHARIAGLKAGVSAGMTTLLKEKHERKEESS